MQQATDRDLLTMTFKTQPHRYTIDLAHPAPKKKYFLAIVHSSTLIFTYTVFLTLTLTLTLTDHTQRTVIQR